MMAIWPVGPPKEMKPSFSQKRNASEKLGCWTRDKGGFSISVLICPEGMRKGRPNTENPDAEFLHPATLPSPILSARDRCRWLQRAGSGCRRDRRRESSRRFSRPPCHERQNAEPAF